MSELKNCPFCGSENVEAKREGAWIVWWAFCNNCHAHSKRMLRRKKIAVENWNSKIDLVEEFTARRIV